MVVLTNIKVLNNEVEEKYGDPKIYVVPKETGKKHTPSKKRKNRSSESTEKAEETREDQTALSVDLKAKIVDVIHELFKSRPLEELTIHKIRKAVAERLDISIMLTGLIPFIKAKISEIVPQYAGNEEEKKTSVDAVKDNKPESKEEGSEAPNMMSNSEIAKDVSENNVSSMNIEGEGNDVGDKELTKQQKLWT